MATKVRGDVTKFMERISQRALDTVRDLEPLELFQRSQAGNPDVSLWFYERYIKGRRLTVSIFTYKLSNDKVHVVVQTFLYSKTFRRCSNVYADGFWIDDSGGVTPFSEKDTWDYT